MYYLYTFKACKRYDLLFENKNDMYLHIKNNDLELPEKIYQTEVGSQFFVKGKKHVVIKSDDEYVIGDFLSLNNSSMNKLYFNSKGDLEDSGNYFFSDYDEWEEEYLENSRKKMKRNDEYIKSCHESYNSVSMRNFKNAYDMVYFFLFDEEDKYVKTHCVSREHLEFICNTSYLLADWVRDETYATNALRIGRLTQDELDMGYGGTQDLNNIYLNIVFGSERTCLRVKGIGYNVNFIHINYTIRDKLGCQFNRLRRKLPGFKMKKTGTKRLINVAGSFGASELHGQLPGEQTFDIEYIPLKEMKNYPGFQNCEEDIDSQDSEVFIEHDSSEYSPTESEYENSDEEDIDEALESLLD